MSITTKQYEKILIRNCSVEKKLEILKTHWISDLKDNQFFCSECGIIYEVKKWGCDICLCILKHKNPNINYNNEILNYIEIDNLLCTRKKILIKKINELYSRLYQKMCLTRAFNSNDINRYIAEFV